MKSKGAMPLIEAVPALCRFTSLPTIWSNCLAGWWLAGGARAHTLPALFLGASCLYFGGTFLNDAFDADWDRYHRRTRPIPAGALSDTLAWQWGLAWFALGVLVLLLGVGLTAGAVGFGLAVCGFLYTVTHRALPISPALLGLCRFLLYILGATAASNSGYGWAIWCALALAFYTTGLGLLARADNTPGAPPSWPAILLAAPILLALVMNSGEALEKAIMLSAILGLWTLRSLRFSLWVQPPERAITLSGLTSGFIFVDWLALADAPKWLSAIILGLYLLVLLLQRFLPASAL
jgi:hypothetical protein